MTRSSFREYATRRRARYPAGRRRAGKRRILDEVVAVAQIHRKAAIRLLRRAPRTAGGAPRRGRPRHCGAEVATAAAVLWQAAGRIGAHRLEPFVVELLERLTVCGELLVPRREQAAAPGQCGHP